jgi:hypothetical protein
MSPEIQLEMSTASEMDGTTMLPGGGTSIEKRNDSEKSYVPKSAFVLE